MGVALTLFMSLQSLSRRTALILVAVCSLLGVACSGADGQQAYAPTDIDLNAESSASVTPSQGCTTGETKSCTIYLGRHGDLANCIEGLDVCSGGEWTGCIDVDSIAENPELVSQLASAQ
jgi:hypothetical protein